MPTTSQEKMNQVLENKKGEVKMTAKHQLAMAKFKEAAEKDLRVINLDGGIFKIWFTQQLNSNMIVGRVAHEATRILLLMTVLPEARTVLKAATGGKGKNLKYTGLDDKQVNSQKVRYIKTTVSEALRAKVLEEVRGLDFNKITDETLIKVLRDLNAIGDMHVQRIIDASKDGSKVDIPFFIGNSAQALGLVEAKTEPLFTEDDMSNAIEKAAKEDSKVRVEGRIATDFHVGGSYVADNGKTYFADKMHQVKLAAHQEQVKALSAAINHHDDMRLSQEILDIFSNIQSKHAKEFDLAVELKVIYNNLTGAYQQKQNEIRLQFNKREISKESMEYMISTEKKFHNERMKALGDIVRSIAGPNMTSVELGNLVKAASSHSQNSDIIDEIGNSFGSTILPEETILSAVDLIDESVDFAGYRVVGSAKELAKVDIQEGGQLEVVNGRLVANPKVIVGQGCADGIYDVFKHNDKFYVGKLLTDLIKPEIPSSIQSIALRVHTSTTKKVEGEKKSKLDILREQMMTADHLVVTSNAYHGSFVWGFIDDKYVRLTEISFKFSDGLYSKAVDMQKFELKQLLTTESGKFVNSVIIGSVTEKFVGVLPSKKDYGKEELFDAQVIAEENNEESEVVVLQQKEETRRRNTELISQMIEFVDEDELPESMQEEDESDEIYEDEDDIDYDEMYI